MHFDCSLADLAEVKEGDTVEFKIDFDDRKGKDQAVPFAVDVYSAQFQKQFSDVFEK